MCPSCGSSSPGLFPHRRDPENMDFFSSQDYRFRGNDTRTQEAVPKLVVGRQLGLLPNPSGLPKSPLYGVLGSLGAAGW
jgi:hypothetical protein